MDGEINRSTRSGQGKRRAMASRGPATSAPMKPSKTGGIGRHPRLPVSGEASTLTAYERRRLEQRVAQGKLSPAEARRLGL